MKFQSTRANARHAVARHATISIFAWSIIGVTLLAIAPSMAQARWYDPDRGHFLSKEPASADGPNLYHFDMSNPVVFVDIDGKDAYVPNPPEISREDFCKNDPCKDKIVTTQTGGSFAGGEKCSCPNSCEEKDEGLNCFEWATCQQNDVPGVGSGPPDSSWSEEPGGVVILYKPGGDWLTSGHGAVYDPESGCAASCSSGTWAGGAPGDKRVVIHHPLCHPRGTVNSPWRTPWYY